MSERHVRRWEATAAKLSQAEKGERSMTLAEWNRMNRRLDKIEKAGRADEYPKGEDPRPWWKR